jgi:hypothetical protein
MFPEQNIREVLKRASTSKPKRGYRVGKQNLFRRYDYGIRIQHKV